MQPVDMREMLHDLVLNEAARPMDSYLIRTLKFVARTMGEQELASRLHAIEMKAYEVCAQGHAAWNDLMDILEKSK